MILRRLANFIFRRAAIRKNVVYAPDLQVGRGCYITAPQKLTIGRAVSIGGWCWIGCNGNIGNGVLISSYVGIAGRYDHDMKKTGVFFSRSPWIYDQPERSIDGAHSVNICDDVWVGFGAIILSGITIGRGAVVGAGAVVTKDVAPYAIVAGNPAREVGMRFTEAEMVRHETGLSRHKD